MRPVTRLAGPQIDDRPSRQGKGRPRPIVRPRAKERGVDDRLFRGIVRVEAASDPHSDRLFTKVS